MGGRMFGGSLFGGMMDPQKLSAMTEARKRLAKKPSTDIPLGGIPDLQARPMTQSSPSGQSVFTRFARGG